MADCQKLVLTFMLSHGPIQRDVANITPVIEAEYKPEFHPTKDNPYLTLTGKLWVAFCGDF